jgi:hypothetical protein
MTDLTKPVRRRARAPYGHYQKRIVVILEPGDILAMRLEKQKVVYRAPLAAVFGVLASWHARANKKGKKK